MNRYAMSFALGLAALLAGIFMFYRYQTAQPAPAPNPAQSASNTPAPGQAPVERFVPVFSDVEALFSDDPAVIDASIEALTQPAEAPRALIDEELVAALEVRSADLSDDVVVALDDALAEHDQWVRQCPAIHTRALVISLREPTAEQAVVVLDECLRYSDEDARAYLVEPLALLAQHPFFKVRRAAVGHALHYLGVGAEPILRDRLSDANGGISRLSWLGLAAIGAVGETEVPYRDMSPKAAEAALLAVALDNPERALDLLAEIEADEIMSRRLITTLSTIRQVAEGASLRHMAQMTGDAEPGGQLVRNALVAENLASGEHPELLVR